MTATTTQTKAPPVQMTREAAIGLIRKALKAYAGDYQCACQVAAERGIFCRGFKRYTDEELKSRYWWLANRWQGLTRAEIEALANAWQLGRQVYHDVELACDVQMIDKDSCGGWDDFTNENLQNYCRELTGINVVVV